MSNEFKVLICFGAHNKWYGRLVRLILDETYNHVFLAYKSVDWQTWMAVEIRDKTCLIPFDKATKRYSQLEIYECSYSLIDGMRSMSGYLGSDYDLLGVLSGLAKSLLWKWFGLKIVKPFQNTSRLFCSEYVAEVLKRSNVPETMFWDSTSMSPEMIRKFVRSNPNFAQVEVVN